LKVQVSNIKWDTDGQGDCGLPSVCMVDIDSTTEAQYLHEAVGIRLHDTYGFNPVTYQFTVLELAT
jgi:hypothetical protein